MFRVYQCLAFEHDHRLVALAILLCLFGSLTSMKIVKRALAYSDTRQVRWLLLGGIVTGIAIWTTHFTAMIAYAPGVDVRFDGLHAIASIVVAIAISSLGWLVAARGPGWPAALGGALVGFALFAAHCFDMSALKISGRIAYDRDLLIVAVGGGIALCALAGWQLRRRPETRFPIGAGLLLAAGVLFLHFVAMSAVSIFPDGRVLADGFDLGLGDIAGIVIAAAALIFAIGLAVAYHDQRLARVTAQDRERLRQSEEHYRYSVELNPQIPWVSNAAGELVEISPRWAEMVGASSRQALGKGWTAYVHPEDLPALMTLWQKALAEGDGELADARYRLRQKGGGYRWIRARARPRRDHAGQIVKWYGTLDDIHEQVAAELALRASEERYRLASRATNDIIWDWEITGNRVAWSDAIETVLGYPEARGGTSVEWWVERLHPGDRAQVIAIQAQIFLPGGDDQWVHEYRMQAGDGRYLHFLSRGYVVRDERGKPVRVLGALLDITDRTRTEAALRWAAHHDPLTELPNRTLFAQRLAAAIDGAGKGCVGLVLLDLDHFKELNDTLGHPAGDALLREVARRVSARLPAGATIARLGGDEFAIVLPHLPGDGRDTVETLLLGLNTPFAIDGRAVEISLSSGCAISPRDGTDPESLLKSADLALYAAKTEAPGSMRGFRPEMREAMEREKRMLTDARQALDHDRIVPFYQPKVCLRTGTLLGFEALLRWHGRDQGLQPPRAIMAAFEDSDLAVQLTDRMLDRVVADMQAWRDRGCGFGRIAINGSAGDFLRGGFAERILGRLAAAGLPPAMLELEVTETVFLGQSSVRVAKALRTLCRAGVTIALDDFGTGYASLSHLKQFPVDTLKIDRSFVSRLTSAETEDGAIVGAVIDLARNLGIATVAEGVETAEQAEYLIARGCDIAQGYLFGRPVAAARIPGLVAHWDAAATLGKCLRASWIGALRGTGTDPRP